jgi:hypothetical protein
MCSPEEKKLYYLRAWDISERRALEFPKKGRKEGPNWSRAPSPAEGPVIELGLKLVGP